ncbi:hypothetical protein MN0502_10270 [Arthrobacter sp. MN05-02]|nr:hypothetical protein MN0502_10270 [Arthrobacter sp. MN05-02]
MREAKVRTASAVLIWIVLIVSVTAWRKGVYFEGSFDSVVIAKAALQGAALAMALLLKRASPVAHPVAGGPLLAVLAVLAVSMIGALEAGGTTASAVLAVRIVLLAVTMVLMVSAFPREEVLTHLVVAIGIVGAVLAITGVGTIGSGGRLEGTLLPISPNGLIVLCAIPALAAIQRVISGRATVGAVVAACFFTLACVATQSRTALLGLAIACVVLIVSVRTIQRYVAVVLAAAVPALFAVAVYTTFFGSLLNRKGSVSLFTLNSRTIAWQVVLQTPFESLQKWVGAGLSVKTVHVQGQYWNDQVLDSSWISALAQTGLVGTAVLAVLVTVVLVVNIRGGRRNALPVALLVFILIRSFLETGLLDASVTFMVFIALASMFVPRPGGSTEGEQSPGIAAVPRASVVDRSYQQTS